MTIRLLGLLAAFSSMLFVACGDDDDDSARTRYIASCRNGCTAANKCTSTVDIDECATTCEEDIQEEGPNLSPAYLDQLDACISEATCAQLAASFYFNTCDAQARAAITATDTVTEFCQAVTREDEHCSRVQRGIVCPDYMKMFSDEALERALPCLDLSCDLQEDCVDDELGTNFGGDNQ